MTNSSSDGIGQDSTQPAAPDEWQVTRAYSPAPSRPASPPETWQPTRALTPSTARPARPTPWQPGRDHAASGNAHPAPIDAWQSTRAQTALATQLFKDEEDYLADPQHDIGRQTGSHERELFVSCDPAQAMQQQFEHLRPEFITVHDIATASSRKLLAGIAAASGRAVQKLVIRRQGYGTALATLEFVELPTADNRSLRLYSTEADADTAARHGLARMLLAFSRLGVVMVGDLPGHAIAAALKPLHEDIVNGPWPNRHLLLLPLAATTALVNQGAELGRGSHVTVRTTPLVTRPADAWGFITGTWSRLREQSDVGSHGAPALAPFTPPANGPRGPAMGGMPAGDTRPMDDARPAAPALQPLPQLQTLGLKPGAATGLLQRYARQVSELTGVAGCCVFEIATGATLAHAAQAASGPDPAELAQQGRALLAAIGGAGGALGLVAAQPEAAITLATHHLLLRGLPKHPGLALHALLDKDAANLTLVRLQVLRMDTLFDEPAS